MKKIIILFVAVLLLIIAILFGVRTYARQNLEKDVAKCIDEFNASLPEGQALTYEGIEPSFSLLSSEVKVKNPVLSTPILVKHSGDVIVGKSLWSERYWVHQIGKTEIIDSENRVTVNINTPWILTAECGKVKDKCPITWENCIAFLKKIDLTIEKGNATLIKDEQEVELVQFEKFRFALDETDKEEMKTTYWTVLDIVNLSFPELNKETLDRIVNESTSLPIYPVEYGIMNYNFQGAVNVPSKKAVEAFVQMFQEDPVSLFQKALQFGYGFDFEASWSDQLVTGTGKYTLESGKKEQGAFARLGVKGDSKLSENYSELLKRALDQLEEELKKPVYINAEVDEELKLFLSKKKGALKELIGDFGNGAEIVADIELSADWMDENAIPDNFNFLFDVLEKQSHYGFKLAGSFKEIDGETAFMGAYEITLRRTMDTIDALASLYRQFTQMVLDVFPDKKVYVLTPNDVAMVKTLLKSFAEDPNAKDLEIKVDMTDPSNPKIGGKPYIEYLINLQQNGV